ncbi:MAG: hypothetical protein WA432_01950 [Candidatus Babeliaceae bacterium]
MKFRPTLLLSCIFLLSCSRYVRYAKCTFQQATKYHDSLKVARQFIRSSYVYDQLNTVALFDILWLSRTVRMSYIDLYAHHWNLPQDTVKNLKEQAEQDLQKVMVFYLLLAPDSDENIISINNTFSRWSVILQINDKKYYPRDMRLEDKLTPEYKAIFGNLDSIHKRVYLVTFDAYDELHQPLINEKTQSFTLLLQATTYATSVCWNL